MTAAEIRLLDRFDGAYLQATGRRVDRRRSSLPAAQRALEVTRAIVEAPTEIDALVVAASRMEMPDEQLHAMVQALRLSSR